MPYLQHNHNHHSVSQAFLPARPRCYHPHMTPPPRQMYPPNPWMPKFRPRSAYERILGLTVRPQDLKPLGYPLLDSEYGWGTLTSGVYVYCEESVQTRRIRQVQSQDYLEREAELLSLHAASTKRYCVNCKLPFLVDSETGECLRREECRHHWGKLITDNRSCIERWTCCKGPGSSPGCNVVPSHAWSGLEPGDNGPFFNYVRTQTTGSKFEVFALDCEMVLTKWGQELAKVTIVDLNGVIVYETMVKPRAEVLDHCTRFSGIRPEDLAHVQMTLQQVQQDILKLVSAETILIGHGLASDLRALRILHYNVVDTVAVFPHPMGLPYRNSLKMLARKHLGISIQRGEHDAAEDAYTAAMLIKSLVF